jgi:hypothetical protein
MKLIGVLPAYCLHGPVLHGTVADVDTAAFCLLLLVGRLMLLAPVLLT